MRQNYSNPPIAEAICDFTFTENSPWSSTLNGQYYEAIRNFYDGPKTDQRQVQTQLEISDKGALQSIAPPLNLTRSLFYNADKTLLTAIRPHGLGTHVLKPYCGWDTFRKRIELDSTSYIDLAEATSIDRIGLRYINQIELPKGKVELTDYFQIAPSRPPIDGQEIQHFTFRTISTVKIGNDRNCRIAVSLVDPQSAGLQNTSGFVVLDVDITCDAKENPILQSQRMVTVDEMKELQRKAFEGAITDQCRGLFK